MQTEDALSQLITFQRSLSDHIGWLQQWYQAVLNQDAVPHPASDRCPFTTWHRHAAATSIGEFVDFQAVHTQHEFVHAIAGQLNERVARGNAPTTSDFEMLMTASLDFGAVAQALERDVWKTLATLDPLTGLANRQFMRNQLLRERDRAIREKKSLCVAIADIDHFKVLNDTYGHPFGDKVLREVASVLNAMVRPYDTVYRYGGEEFLICLPGIDLDSALPALDRIRRAIAKLTVTHQVGTQVTVTITLGVAELDADVSVEDGIEYADKALYSGKQAGRNRVVIYARPK